MACIVLLLLACYFSLKILTIPIVMKNMLTIINIIFTFIGLAIAVFGAFMSKHQDMEAGNEWIAYTFVAVGGFLFVMSMFGIIGSRSKSRSLLMIYIIGVFFCLFTLFVCGFCAFIFTDTLSRKFEQMDVGEIACSANLKSCSNCSTIDSERVKCYGVYQNNGVWTECNDSNTNSDMCKQGLTVIHKNPTDQTYFKVDIAPCGRCPQWTKDDVEGFVENGLQFIGLLAVLVCLFLIVGMAGAIILYRSLKGYQTDSI